MPHVSQSLVALALLAGAAILEISPATAAEGDILTVRTNMARVLRIDQPAATVIIGNPGVADVTIQDPTTLILTAKSFGQTNMIILDSNGEPIADTMIEVIQASADVVTMYQGTARTSLSCTPVCQPTITLGDDNAYTSNSIASANMVEASAQ